MPDISMCKNNKCPARRDCYRFRADPSEMQAYADFRPDDGYNSCEYFVDVKAYPKYMLKPIRD